MLRARKTWLVLGLALLACSGCTKRRNANIVSHPDWQYQDYRRLAILPFQVDRREAVDPARQSEAYLVDLLTQNGAFEVLTRSDLGDVLTEQDLSRLADVSDPNTTLPEGKIKAAQAVVIAKLIGLDLKQEEKEVRRPHYAYDRRGRVIRDRATGQPIVASYDVYVQYRNVARLGGTVRVLDAATGHVLVSFTVPPLEKDDAQLGHRPGSTPEAMAEDLARELAAEFYRKIAPISVEVKLNGDCLAIAAADAGYFEGRYDELKSVPANLPAILMIVRDLPKQCDRNQFRVAIAPKDGREYLAEHEFTWSPSLGHRGEAVEVPLSKLTAAGGEKFVVKLFSAGGDQPILEREFSLEKPKKVD